MLKANKNTSKGGAPIKPNHLKRTNIVKTLLNDEDYNKFLIKIGTTKSSKVLHNLITVDYLNNLNPTTITNNSTASRELRTTILKISNNLNQLTKKINSGFYNKDVYLKTLKAIHELTNIFSNIYSKL